MAKSLEQFKIDTMGGSYGNPGTGTYRGQCVSYVRLYIEEVLGIKTAVWGNAVDYWTNPAVLAHFDRIPADQGKDGDIGVWGDDPGNWTGKEGHIAIKYGSYILNQNYGGSLKVSLNPMFTAGFLGYLRLKGDNEVKIGGGDNWYWRFNRLHHQLVRNGDLDRSVFNNIIGHDAWKIVESWSDHSEANQLIADQELGELARKDNWQGQIYRLQDQVNALSTRPTKEQLDELTKQMETLAKSADTAQAERDALKRQAAEDEEVGRSFFRRLGDWLKSTGIFK